MKLYISGKITGDDNYREKFAEAEKAFTRCGYDTVNPAAMDIEGGEYSDYMKRDIPLLLGCDGIALLPDWNTSHGANLERDIANACGLTLGTVEGWCNRAKHKGATA